MFLLTCAMTFRLFVFASVCFPRRNVVWRCTTHSSIADGRKGVMLQRANVFLTLHCHAFFPQINALFQDLKVQMLLLSFCLCVYFWKELAFPSNEITVLAPEAVKQWKLVAKTQSVSWQFIMWMEVYLCLPVLVLPLHSDWFAQIILASFQTPTAVLETTVQIFSCSLLARLLYCIVFRHQSRYIRWYGRSFYIRDQQLHHQFVECILTSTKRSSVALMKNSNKKK